MRLDEHGMPLLTEAQRGRLPVIPGPGADLDAIWRWAATTSPQAIPGAFQHHRYYFGLRKAQGWCPYTTPTQEPASGRCHSDGDGDCQWSGCPQLRDREPETSGRSCPLDLDRAEDWVA